MQNTTRAILRKPFYPWLLGIYPILHLYTENLGLVIDSEVAPSVLLVQVGTGIVFIICKRLIQDLHLAAMFTSLCVIVYSLSGHVYELVFMPRSLGVWTLALLLGLAVTGIWLRKTGPRKVLAQATPSFNLIMLALVAFQAIRLAIGFVDMSKYVDVYADYSALVANRPLTPKVKDSREKPDIYFIIPDGYPSDAWLKATANYDNAEFTQALEDRGFVVVDHAQSNYPITLLSLASTLNMRYYSSNPSPYSDEMYLKSESATSAVSNHLGDLGYTYIQLLTSTLLPSPTADVIKYFTLQGVLDIEVDDFAAHIGELLDGKTNDGATVSMTRVIKHSFFAAYIDTTLFRLARSRLLPAIHREQPISYSDKSPEKFLEQIEEAIRISQMPEATFAIIHLWKPHQPVVFNEKGEHISWIPWPTNEEFGAQMNYINSRLLYLIDSILANSENPPVILFQADHSSILGNAPLDHRFTYFDVYAAYYLPSPREVDFPNPFTTVNAFTLILNEVFKAEFALQDNRLFELTQRYKAPFAQVDVTDEFLNDA